MPRHAEQLPEAVQQQPAGIQGQMREYQLEGVKFLVSSFDQGIHPILAGMRQCDSLTMPFNRQTVNASTCLS